MHANPGGVLAPEEVVGRDGLIGGLWRTLAGQSVVLAAERRLGKTSILRKMTASPAPAWIPIFRDLEDIRSPAEFVEILRTDVEDYLSRKERVAQRFRDACRTIAGGEVIGIKLPPAAASHWKPLLSRLMEDLADNQIDRVVFLWDEMPLMLDNIKRRIGEDAAMELLDVLRATRQMHPSIRMVFTGSIGLHHVLGALKRAGHANAPINDMQIIDVPALDEADAIQLAALLLDGESIPTDDREATAVTIARKVDGLPFFIHHVVDQLAKQGGPAGPTRVNDLVDAYLLAPQDPWNLRYYHERIDTYYPAAEMPYARAVLDALAAAAEAQQFTQLVETTRSRVPELDLERLRAVLTLLQRDHYLVQATEGYRFRFSIIRRHWRTFRGTSA